MKKKSNIEKWIISRAKWIAEAKANLADPTNCPSPDRLRLLEGLPEFVPCMKLPTSGLDQDGLPVITGQKIKLADGEMRSRSWRWVDAATHLLVQLLLAFGETIRVETNKSGEDGQHYLALFNKYPKKVWLLRLIVDAQEGRVANEAIGGKGMDYRRRALRSPMRTVDQVRASGKEMRSPTKGREHAIEVALANYRAYVARYGGISLSEDGYEFLIRDAFALIDAIPLGDDACRQQGAQ